MPRSSVPLRRCAQWIIAVVVLAMTVPSLAAERGFPYDSELMLDAKPMKGSKRVPVIGIGPRGEATIDMWCNSVQGQLVVADNTITVLTGTKTERQCDAARMRGDDDLLTDLAQATTWSRNGDVITLQGSKTLRFRQLTN
jgi:heat shock protein HslJ